MEYKTIGWRAASKYTKRAVYWRRERDGAYLRVAAVRRRGPNIRITLENGLEFEAARSRLFYARTRGNGKAAL